ncbi:variant SH3 domain protein [Ancylostoma duodenale]|uniref:Variant SH3 domain protein n=1 Tax=Ancylostoma duodenale TaxID=51022 RepID=A0A0C2HAX3_9BILA|nr:variant SH3 domain protein [Ancylostoma duodenale]
MSLSASPAPPVAGLGPLVAGAGPPSADSLLLTLRNKPHARVFRALFQYLPLRDSPNENPQLELALAPGDVLLVKGEMDSDGFYRAETLDGRTGLVPSNYVERVPDSVLLCNARAPSPSFPLHVPQHHSSITHDFSEPDHSQLPDSVCPYPPADVSKVTVQEIKQNDMPCPRDLVVEKKMSRSVVVAWSPPEESFVAVSQYHVCVDGQVRAVVPGSYKVRTSFTLFVPLSQSTFTAFY